MRAVVTVCAVVGVVAGCTASPDAGVDAKPGSKGSRPTAGPTGGGSGPAGGGQPVRGLPGLSSAKVARGELAALKVATERSMSGYSRDSFRHWVGQGDSCDTRELVLQRAGTDVQRDASCKAVSGRWVSAYDGLVITDAKKLDIDHMVPLAAAWRSGAAGWNADKRQQFANDLVRPQLLAVSAATNRGKGDQTPDEWTPPARTFWCTYATAWTNVKSFYGLTVTGPEKSKLGEMLGTCAS